MENGLSALHTPEWLNGLLLDGIVGGVGAVLGFVPQMLVLFILLAFLESCGYMARIAFVMDRIFRKFGLSGKSFIPMLMDTGGNCGSQASVTVIRGISLQEITFADTFKVLWKELRVSILCGATLAVTNFIKLLLIDRVTILVALVISLTILCTVVIAKLVGCSLPILAKRLGFDPAVMASPFITTIVDAVSLFIYFNIAGMILGL